VSSRGKSLQLSKVAGTEVSLAEAPASMRRVPRRECKTARLQVHEPGKNLSERGGVASESIARAPQCGLDACSLCRVEIRDDSNIIEGSTGNSKLVFHK
jgi:hypothetical protein